MQKRENISVRTDSSIDSPVISQMARMAARWREVTRDGSPFAAHKEPAGDHAGGFLVYERFELLDQSATYLERRAGATNEEHHSLTLVYRSS
jgi:hypothetical protein